MAIFRNFFPIMAIENLKKKLDYGTLNFNIDFWLQIAGPKKMLTGDHPQEDLAKFAYTSERKPDTLERVV
jgi:hypothetical protein